MSLPLNYPWILPAPCKLNLFLHINGRRTDGYHLLQTIFQMLDVGDELHFTPNHASEVTLRCSDPSLNGTDNLIYRAAMLLKPLAAVDAGVDIFLDKRTPMGGGLGGGSSDAATTLHALNVLWNLGLTPQQLAELGLKLGADVPVFVHGQTAFGQGVGEDLQPIALPERFFLVVTPDVHVSTAEVFTHPDLIRNSKPLTFGSVLDSEWRNDCQPLVETTVPACCINLTVVGRIRAVSNDGYWC